VSQRTRPASTKREPPITKPEGKRRVSGDKAERATGETSSAPQVVPGEAPPSTVQAEGGQDPETIEDTTYVEMHELEEHFTKRFTKKSPPQKSSPWESSPAAGMRARLPLPFSVPVGMDGRDARPLGTEGE
jgi:hypothetical protein